MQLTNGKKQRAVASFFNICPGIIYKHNLRRLSDKKNVGAPACLNDDELVTVSNFIQEKYQEKKLSNNYIMH